VARAHNVWVKNSITKGQVAQLSDTLHTSDKGAQHMNAFQNDWVTSCTTTERQVAHQLSGKLQNGWVVTNCRANAWWLVAQQPSGDKLQNKWVVINCGIEWWQISEQLSGNKLQNNRVVTSCTTTERQVTQQPSGKLQNNWVVTQS
jgi:hypothetical protein